MPRHVMVMSRAMGPAATTSILSSTGLMLSTTRWTGARRPTQKSAVYQYCCPPQLILSRPASSIVTKFKADGRSPTPTDTILEASMPAPVVPSGRTVIIALDNSSGTTSCNHCPTSISQFLTLLACCCFARKPLPNTSCIMIAAVGVLASSKFLLVALLAESAKIVTWATANLLKPGRTFTCRRSHEFMSRHTHSMHNMHDCGTLGVRTRATRVLERALLTGTGYHVMWPEHES
jgi:hypothetical protein